MSSTPLHPSQSFEQGSLFVDNGMLPNPELYDAQLHPTNDLLVAGIDITTLFGSVDPLSDEEHRKTGELTRSVFHRLSTEPTAVLLGKIEDPLWIVDRKDYLDTVATTIGKASLGVPQAERSRKIASGVGQTRGDMRRKFNNLKTAAERMQFSAGIALSLVGEGEDCGFDRLTALHHISSANAGLEELFEEVARVEYPALRGNPEGRDLARKVRTQALTVITRPDDSQAERLQTWYRRLVLNSERKVAFWDQQVQIANGVTFERSEIIRPINTAAEHRHVGKPGYPHKRRP